MSYQLYPSDLTDREWDCIKSLIPAAKRGGRPRQLDMRLVINALFYVLRGGISWRMLPREYPHWKSVYHYFRLFRLDGTWQMMHDRLREQVRRRAGREVEPSAAILDSQSVKSTEAGGPERGFDGGKRARGRKRHILVDTLGLLLIVVVHAANTQDRRGARRVLEGLREGLARLKLIWVDSGYRSEPLKKWLTELREEAPVEMEIVKRREDERGFHLLPKRWVVERTFAWLGRHRRLSKDYEKLPATSETLIRLAMIKLMVRRLAV